MGDKEIHFLEQSNYIEREYSDEALADAITAWKYAKRIRTRLNLNHIRQIHKRLLINLNPEIAGKFRRVQVGVMTSEGFKEAIHWTEIKEELRLLCNPGICPTNSESLIKTWHIEFEHIHPFEDGNGRVGRIIMNIQRLKEGLPILIIHEGKEQFEYYKWFKDSYKNGGKN